MTFNYENRREIAANRSYHAEMVNKQNMLARRIKSDDKKTNLDINKIYTEIRNGNLAVLEDLDKAGISYQLSNNGQAFDDKTDDYSVTFEIDGATYTAYHEGLTKEQEEAKAKAKNTECKSLTHSFKEFKGAQFISMTKAAEIRKDYSANRSEETLQEPVQENGPTTVQNIDVNNNLYGGAASTSASTETGNNSAIDTTQSSTTGQEVVSSSAESTQSDATSINKDADALWEKIINDAANMQDKSFYDYNTGGAGSNSEYNDCKEYLKNYTSNIQEYLKIKYNFSNDYAEFLLDYIYDKSYKETVKYTDDIPYQTERWIITAAYDAKLILNNMIKYIQNPENITDPDIKLFGEELKIYNGFPYDCEDNLYVKLISKFRFYKGFTSAANELSLDYAYKEIRSRLSELGLNNNDGISVEQLKQLDKNGNGFMDDLFEIINDAFNHRKQLSCDAFEKYISRFVEYNDIMDVDDIKCITQYLSAADIFYIENENWNADCKTKTLLFSYNGIDYKITLNEDITSSEHTSYSTIESKPSKNNSNNTNTLESQLEWNISMLSENPEYASDASLNIMSILDQLGIYHSGKVCYNETTGRYDQNPSPLVFSFNGLDYEICSYAEDKYIENPRTMDDVTEDDINEKLSLFDWGNDLTFWDGKWNDCPWFPEYDENWEREIDYLLESYYDNCPYHGNNSGGSAITNICTNYLIDILRNKCGIEDYTASKEANLTALIEYLKSIDAYTHDDKLNKTTIEWTKVYRILYDENPKFKKLIDKWAMGDTFIYDGSDYHVIIRTRPTEGMNYKECPEELRDDLKHAITYPEQFELDFRAKVDNAIKKAYNKIENQIEDKTERIWFNKEYQELVRNIYKENMIYACNVLSYIPEYKRIIEELFGLNYIDGITIYCQTADFHNINCSSSNNPESLNPIYLLFDKMKEYIKNSEDPNNKNGYTDVYYK